MFVTESDFVLWGEVLYRCRRYVCTLKSEQQVYRAICFVFKASVYSVH